MQKISNQFRDPKVNQRKKHGNKSNRDEYSDCITNHLSACRPTDEFRFPDNISQKLRYVCHSELTSNFATTSFPCERYEFCKTYSIFSVPSVPFWNCSLAAYNFSGRTRCRLTLLYSDLPFHTPSRPHTLISLISLYHRVCNSVNSHKTTFGNICTCYR